MDRLIKLLYNPEKIVKPSEAHGDIPNTKEIFLRVFKVAWPSTLEAFLVALVTMMDTVMVSGLGESAVAAIGLTAQPRFIALSMVMANNVAVSAIVARRRGENNQKAANLTLRNALGLILIITALFSVLSVAFVDPVLRFVGSNADTHAMASEYLQIIMAGLVFQTVTLTINAAQRGSGNTRIVMRCNLVSNGVNLIFNYLLIHGNFGFPALGIAGAAIATVIGTVVAMLMAIISALPGKNFVELSSLKFFSFDKATLKGLFKVSLPTLVEQLFMRFGFLSVAIIAASLGTIAFAANQVANNITMLSFSFADGLSIAAVALVGRSLGELRPDFAKLYGAMCQRIGFCVSVLSAIVFQLFGTAIFRLFSDDEQILEYSRMLTIAMSITVLMQITQFIYTGCLRGAGDNRFTAFISLISVAIVRPLASYLFCYTFDLGLTGLWIGLIIDQTVRMLFASLRFKQGKWTKIKL